MNFLEFLSTLVWPGIVFYLIYNFKNDISSLLKRLKSTKIGNNSFDFEQDSQVQEETSSIIESLLEHPIVYKTQNAIEAKIAENLKDEEAINKFCRRTTPFMYISYIFYKIYTYIFGSQIEVLYYLDKIYKVKIDHLKRFYDKAQNDYPTEYQSITFENYILFLQNNGLIENEGEYYKLSAQGKDFLEFIKFEKLPQRGL